LALRVETVVEECLHFVVKLQAILLQEHHMRCLSNLNESPLRSIDKFAEHRLCPCRRRDAIPVSDDD
jgi:hypothetical protein